LRQVGAGCNLNSGTVWTTVLIAHHIAVAQYILGQENHRRDVACSREPKEMAANRNPALCLGAIHSFCEFLVLSSPLDCARADAQESGRLLVGTLESIELFQFDKVDLGLRTGHGSLLLQENPQLETQVRKRQTKS